MANSASARKRARQTVERTLRNRSIRSRTRTIIKRTRAAINESDVAGAHDALQAAIQRIDRAVAKGVYHRKTGSRYISRLTQQVRKLSEQTS